MNAPSNTPELDFKAALTKEQIREIYSQMGASTANHRICIALLGRSKSQLTESLSRDFNSANELLTTTSAHLNHSKAQLELAESAHARVMLVIQEILGE